MFFQLTSSTDGINYPEFGQLDRQIFGPDTYPAVNLATYDFSVTA